MEGLYDAIEWLGALLAILLIIYSAVVKPPLLQIGKTALFMAFGLVETFGFFMFVAYVRDASISILAFVFLLYLSYVAAEKLDQI